MKSQEDVVIAGGGPVGLLTAIALAQEGVGVTVLEAEPVIPRSPRAPVYFPSTLTAIAELGLLDDLSKVASVGRDFQTIFPDRNARSTLSFGVLEGVSFPYTLNIGQDRLADIAVEHARRLGVEVLFGHRLESFEDEAGGVLAQIETPSGRARIRGKWLIGADGARSTVRRILDLDFEGTTWPVRFVAANVYCDLGAAGYAAGNFITDPVDHAIIVTLEEKTELWRIAYSEEATLDPDGVEGRFAENCARPFIPAGMPYEIQGINQYALHQRAASRFRAGHVLLAGDAAHATSPTGGLGLSGGVWDGMILADILAAVVKGTAPDAMLDAYAAERRRIFWEVVTPGASENMRFLMEKDPARRESDYVNALAAAANPMIARMILLFAFKLIGNTIRPGSRWADADPTPRAGIDMSRLHAQTGDFSEAEKAVGQRA